MCTKSLSTLHIILVTLSQYNVSNHWLQESKLPLSIDCFLGGWIAFAVFILRETDRVICPVRPWKSLRDLGFKLSYHTYTRYIADCAAYPPDSAKFRSSDSCVCIAVVLFFCLSTHALAWSRLCRILQIVGVLCLGSIQVKPCCT
jgi:hypothetical protein